MRRGSCSTPYPPASVHPPFLSPLPERTHNSSASKQLRWPEQNQTRNMKNATVITLSSVRRSALDMSKHQKRTAILSHQYNVRRVGGSGIEARARFERIFTSLAPGLWAHREPLRDVSPHGKDRTGRIKHRKLIDTYKPLFEYIHLTQNLTET